MGKDLELDHEHARDDESVGQEVMPGDRGGGHERHGQEDGRGLAQ